MKRIAITLVTLLALAACGVDTTGLSGDSSKGPNPKSNANAAVTVTEYGDFQCPACKAAYTLVVQPLLTQYGSQARFEFKQFPLVNVHAYAMAAAEASECAADQGKFWEFLDYDYTHQDELSTSALEDWGKQLGLDTALYDRCRASHIKKKMIMAQESEGEGLGVQGTPTFFVNGKQVESTVDALGKAITDAQANAGKNL